MKIMKQFMPIATSILIVSTFSAKATDDKEKDVFERPQTPAHTQQETWKLEQLAKEMPPESYEAHLQSLVKENKLDPNVLPQVRALTKLE